ncbi:MAG: glycosyltransferase family 2 protein, partial [Deltaproteobacteria bacterium]|nr:glycosyltransferase family 2 protein [Deltaproteobacteria bacterium]
MATGKQHEVKVAIIIPVLNEEEAIGRVLEELPAARRELVIVVDNGSCDRSPEIARAAGATVLLAPERGYGRACLKGMSWLEEQGIEPRAVVFLDGDYSDYPAEIELLLGPLLAGDFDFVLG